MSGLGETLEENSRLRERLASVEAAAALLLAQVESAAAERDSAVASRDTLASEHDLALAKVDLLTRRTERLELLLARFQNKLRGPASERFVADQPSLFEGLPTPVPAVLLPSEADTERDEADAHPPRAKPTRGTPKRRNLSADTSLPHRTVPAVMPEGAACAGCGGDLRVIGTSVAHRVEWVSGHFEILDIVREKCACPACPSEGVLSAELPFALPGALCGNGLLGRVLVDKFADHLPLNRQATRMAREGFEVDTTTLSSWVVRAAAMLQPLAKAVRDEVLSADVLQADDTGFPVQDGTGGQLRKGRLWAFTDQEQVVYVFTDTKQGVHPAAFLEGFRGHTLVVDGGSEFNAAVDALALERAGCWSHARRYFHEARDAHPREAGVVLDVVQRLFLLERGWAALTPEERRDARQREAAPLVDGLLRWAEQLSTVARPTSALGSAIGYLRNQEDTLRVFLDDGAVPLHNNLSELLLRQPVVGRKNWLFAGSEGGALAAATMFTLIGSCRLQGIDPTMWLTEVLAKLTLWPANRVRELTPKGWKQARHSV